MTEKKSSNPNHYTIFSGDGTRILHEQNGREQSEVITGGSGRILYKSGNEEASGDKAWTIEPILLALSGTDIP
jgi:hypothetical protein